jgi:hypothetical protein
VSGCCGSCHDQSIIVLARVRQPHPFAELCSACADQYRRVTHSVVPSVLTERQVCHGCRCSVVRVNRLQRKCVLVMSRRMLTCVTKTSKARGIRPRGAPRLAADKTTISVDGRGVLRYPDAACIRRVCL